MFDALLTQAVNHFEDPSFGGFEGTMEKMTKADPEFVLGHALRLGLIGSHVDKDPKYAEEISKMAELAKKDHVKPWERQHANAVRLFAEGEIVAASNQWEEILIENPRDMMSLRFLHDMYIVNGQSKRLRDSVGRVVTYWTPGTPLYGDILSMYAFGLEETNFYKEAEEMARKALDINPYDAWAAHAIAHCKEMTCKFAQGVKFMEETESDWSDNDLGCHNYWHWALFNYEYGNFESALGILDDEILPRMKKKRTNFSVTDAAALMFRLQAEGENLGQTRWDDVFDVAKSHTEDHIWSFTDMNVFIACLGAGHKDEAKKMLESIKTYSKSGRGDIKGIYADVTIPLMEAFDAFFTGDYDTTVEIMKSLRYDVQRIGGSHAQRDLFSLLPLYAALGSQKPENQRYAKHLLLERQSYKGADTPLINRLTEKLVLPDD